MKFLDVHLSLAPQPDAVPTFTSHHVFYGERTNLVTTPSVKELDHLIAALQRLRSKEKF